jgi:hypothetical protein
MPKPAAEAGFIWIGLVIWLKHILITNQNVICLKSSPNESNAMWLNRPRKTHVCYFGIKAPYSFEGGYRSAGSAAPPKIGVFPQRLKPDPFLANYGMAEAIP